MVPLCGAPRDMIRSAMDRDGRDLQDGTSGSVRGHMFRCGSPLRSGPVGGQAAGPCAGGFQLLMDESVSGSSHHLTPSVAGNSISIDADNCNHTQHFFSNSASSSSSLTKVYSVTPHKKRGKSPSNFPINDELTRRVPLTGVLSPPPVRDDMTSC